VANDIGMHESTISRATSNKYVHTSQGLFELKYFFNEGINREDGGEEIASEAVRRFIKTMVSGGGLEKAVLGPKARRAAKCAAQNRYCAQNRGQVSRADGNFTVGTA
jgi:hypothetical protein